MNYIVLIIISFFIFSCSKTNEDMMIDNQLPPQPVGPQVLKQIKVLQPGVFPNYITYHWTAGKLMAIDSGTNSFSYNLQYSGDQISVINQTYGQGAQLIIRKSVFNYTNGKLTSISGDESSTSGDYTFITTISYNGDIPAIVEKNFYESGVAFYRESGALEFTGGNLTKFTSTYGYSAPLFSTVTTFSNFDNAINPFNTLPLAFNLSNSFRNKESFSVVGLSSNNHLVSSNSNGTENTTYTYGSNGYPIKAVKSGITYEYTYAEL